MTDWNPPATCVNGHALAYPNAVVNWTPCSCGKASGRPTGHRQVLCWTCKWRWREDGCDELPVEQASPDVGEEGGPPA